jgi:hypothetical protein
MAGVNQWKTIRLQLGWLGCKSRSSQASWAVESQLSHVCVRCDCSMQLQACCRDAADASIV